MPSEMLARYAKEFRSYVAAIIDDYDNGRLTLEAAKARIGIMCKDSLEKTYDRAFTDGLAAAEIDDDPGEEEVEFDFDEGDEPT